LNPGSRIFFFSLTLQKKFRDDPVKSLCDHGARPSLIALRA
jgi:hypothetical protein